MLSYRYIAIEGNIGSGKTTLAQKLAEYLDARLILEEFADNPFLAHFYKDAKRYAFPLELSFLADRYQQLKGIINTQDLFQQHIVSDYIFPKTKIFAKINLEEHEFELFSRMAEILKLELTTPDLLIYLKTPISKLQSNIKKRNRSYEQEIEDQYLINLEKGYLQYLQNADVNLLMIDMENIDLHDEHHFYQIINYLKDNKNISNSLFFIK